MPNPKDRIYRYLKPMKLASSQNVICYGFDTETHKNNQKLTLCSFVDQSGNARVFYEKEQAISWLNDLNSRAKRRRRRIYMICTNVNFDVSALFRKENKSIDPIKPIFRGSEMILAKYDKIMFIDTANYYGKVSVEKLGELLDLKKLKKPSFLGRKPKNKLEWEELKRYNIRDSEISLKSWLMLKSKLNNLGGKIKFTIASSALDLYRRRFQKQNFRSSTLEEIEFIRRGYYGGRTEAFCRGNITASGKKMYVYDINSMYPFVMRNWLPNPNSAKWIRSPSMARILELEGFSEVIIVSPEHIEYPFLPYRDPETEKLIFPLGRLKGVYSHVELRIALDLGYKVLKIKKQLVYNRYCLPFRDYVDSLYKMRLEASNEQEKTVIKLLLNSLYGKFGARMEESEEFHSMNDLFAKGQPPDGWKPVDDNYYIVKKKLEEKDVPAYVIPVYSAYITSHARILLYSYFKEKPAYCDTDSIFIDHTIPESKQLGDVKLEYCADEGIIIRPKFYYAGEKVKAKGFHKLQKTEFLNLVKEGRREETKFLKFREALRSSKHKGEFNAVIKYERRVILEDDKRVWSGKLDLNKFEESEPIVIC